jgi:hypothetical protein
MKPWPIALVMAGILFLASGCVERRYVITTEPPGAKVLRNGQDLGTAPADDHFVYYGNYHFTLIKDGYEIQQIDQNIPTPWYEYPVLDFFSENIIPWKIRDVHRFHYTMQPVQNPNIKDVLDKAEKLQNHGRSLTPFAPTSQKPVADNSAKPTDPSGSRIRENSD